jgi:hypothetical protein
VFVSLPTQGTALGLANGQTMRNSTYTVTLGDVAWKDVWYAHPAGFGNTLKVDGETIENGARTAYNATRVCTTSP